MDARVHLFGIRHHGPGSAASLVAALDRLDPAAVLIEGPSDANDLVLYAALPGMQPPVALLVHAVDEPDRASFFPFASFSPEWRALIWALERQRPVRFIDWPSSHALAVRKERAAAVSEPTEPETDGPGLRSDPLDAIAQVSGHSDGEAFWNAMVESVGGSPDVFPIIESAIDELRRAQTPDAATDTGRTEDDARREAFMRLQIREALGSSDGAIAVVTGAWHVPALREEKSIASDRALLRGLPKLKTTATWIPWTEARLAMASGYGAGVASPGWYGHLWSQTDTSGAWPTARDLAASWLSKVATLLRAEGQQASTASVIEAARLAIALASLRGHVMPGLAEMRDATLAALCHGDAAPFRIIETRLVIGDRVGRIDDGVPQMPLAAVHTEVTFEAQTGLAANIISANGDVPGSGDISIPPTPSFPSLPPFPVIIPGTVEFDEDAEMPAILHDTTKGLLYTTNINTANPQWITVNAGLTAAQYQNINNFFVTPNGALYAAYVRGVDNSNYLLRPFFIARAPSIGGTFTVLYDEPAIRPTPTAGNNWGLWAVGYNPLVAEKAAFVMGTCNVDKKFWTGAGASFAAGAVVDTSSFLVGGLTYGFGAWLYTRLAHFSKIAPGGGSVITTGSPAIDNLVTSGTPLTGHIRAGSTARTFHMKQGGGGLVVGDNNLASITTYTYAPTSFFGFGLACDPTGTYLMGRHDTGVKGKSSDSGATWSALSSLPPGNWWWSYAGSPQWWVAVGGSSIRMTQDFGTTWLNREGNLLSVAPIPDIDMVKVLI